VPPKSTPRHKAPRSFADLPFAKANRQIEESYRWGKKRPADAGLYDAIFKLPV